MTAPKQEGKQGLVALIALAVIVPAGAYALPYMTSTVYERGVEVAKVDKKEKKEVAEKPRTPDPLKGIYMTQCAVGTPSLRDSLVKFIDETDLNAVVIDIKDFSGTIAFATTDPRFEEASLVNCGASNMKAFVEELKGKGIYTIARITVFQDPHYTKRYPEQAVQSKSRPGQPWKDHKGLSFVDVSSKPFWEYIVKLSEETVALGFDEINYDYIRYPSDGPMDDAAYQNPNKPEALERFFKYLHEEVTPMGVVISADLFGMVTSNTDDLGIGQVLERALPYFDYIMPMVYPSHYPDGFNGYSDPNLYPYEIIKFAMDRAVARTVASETSVRTLDGKPIMKTETYFDGTATTTREVATGMYTKEPYSKLKIRPWLQDFDYGKEYLPRDILAQTQGTYDAGLTSWVFWDPSNRYESLRAVMAK